MIRLYILRNRFWRQVALWACDRADRSYDAFLQRYDR